MAERKHVNGVQLPPGWEIPKLNEIARINPALDRCITDDHVQVTFVPMRAVNEEGGGLARPEVRAYGAVKKGYTSFLSGDVIMAKITPCMENGKTTVVPDVPNQVCFGSTEFHVVRPEEGVQGRWIAQFLLQQEVRRVAQRQMTGGVGQMRVPAAFLEDTRIPLAPGQEQVRIADVLDELFSDLDAGVAALERVRDKLKLYRASVLKAAVEGSLTAEWRAQHPHTEPATELLKRILSERRRRWGEERLAKFRVKGQEPSNDWKAKYKEPVTPDTTNLPLLPEPWCWATAEQCTSVITDGEHITPQRSAAGVLLLSARNVLDGRLSLADVDYVPQSEYERISKRLVVEPGDVLLSCSGTVGRSAVAPEGLTFALVRSVAVLKPIFEMGAFLSIAFRSPLLQQEIFRKKTQTAQSNIFQGKIKTLRIPLAPIQDQVAIVDAIEDQLSVIDHLEADLDAKLKSAQGLRQAILRRAFTGKLVSQDPNDEPASELLRRIAAEREVRQRKAATTKRPTKTKTETN